MAVLDRSLFTNPIPSAPPGIQGMQNMAMPPRLRPDTPGGVMGFACGGEVAPVRMAGGGDPNDQQPQGPHSYGRSGLREGSVIDYAIRGDEEGFRGGLSEAIAFITSTPVGAVTEALHLLGYDINDPVGGYEDMRDIADKVLAVTRDPTQSSLSSSSGETSDASTADEIKAKQDMTNVISENPGAEKVVSDVDNVMERAEENEDPAAAMLSLVPDMHSQITDNPEENKRILGKWITQAASQSIGVDFNADDPQEDPARSHEASLALNLALIQAGGAMMASQSPTLTGAMGEGSQVFASTYGEGLKDIKEREHELEKQKIASEGKEDTALIRNAQAYRNACLTAKSENPKAACDTSELGAMNWANQTASLPEEVTKLALKCVQSHLGSEVECVARAKAAVGIGLAKLADNGGIGPGGTGAEVGTAGTTGLPIFYSADDPGFDELPPGADFIDGESGEPMTKK